MTMTTQAARENLIHGPIEAIEEAAKTWAATATDGEAVWVVARTMIPDMWTEYEYIALGTILGHKDALREQVEAIACATMDPAVIATVDEARARIAQLPD